MLEAQLHLARSGHVLIEQLLDESSCAHLAACAPAVPARTGGLRDPLHDWPQSRAALGILRALADDLMQARARLVRAILFDKTPASNWVVPWHQDLSIAVREQHDVPGYEAWSRKQGVWHVQPPAEMLERMLTLRLHLDDCDADNAPLQVLPGTHNQGRFDEARIATQAAQGQAVVCTARAGDVLAMRPTLLHASNKARLLMRRRVLHLEFAAGELPAPLRWHAADEPLAAARSW